MRKIIPLFAVSLLITSSAFACDICSVYNAPETKAHNANTVEVGVSEQYTRYNNVQYKGRVITQERSGNQEMNSSLTNVSLTYFFTPEVEAHVIAPLIDRSYKRLNDEGSRESGSESGLGDLILMSGYEAVRNTHDNGLFLWKLNAGVKLPTGSSDRLGEEESESHMHTESLLRHGDVIEGDFMQPVIHGHDLALGSGSTDVILGTGAVWQSDRKQLSAALQYTLRTEGDHNYQYADDLSWEVSPGAYLALDHDFSFLASLNLSGEHKNKDTFNGAKEDDTALTTLFIGPGFAANVGERYRFKLNFDFPADINNSGLQATADWRFRGGVDISL